MNENEQMEQNVAEQAEPKAKEPEKKYTDAEVDKIVQDRLAREQKKREKEVAEAEKLAKMNEKERYDYEVSELKKELDALKAEKNRSEMMTTARHMLANDGLNVSDELISVLVTADAEQTNEAVKNFSKLFKAEVDKIVQDRLAREQKKREKEVAEAEKLAKMNEKERYDYEVSELKKELDALKAEKSRSEMMTTARHMLANDGLNVSDALIGVLVTSDAEQTNEAVKAFSKLLKEEIDKGVKAQLAGGNPKKGSTSALTREQIFAIKDPNKRLKAIEENMDLFNQKG
jgi:putative hemolysin